MNNNEINDLKIDEIIWIIFIFLSILNIIGDEYKKDYYTNNKKESEKQSKNIFLLTVLISLIIYIYIAYKRYKLVKYNYAHNLDNKIAIKRLIGSILVVIASILFLECQSKECSDSNPSIL